jgi:hypothetical protein
MNPNSAAVAAADREMALAVLEQAIPIVLLCDGTIRGGQGVALPFTARGWWMSVAPPARTVAGRLGSRRRRLHDRCSRAARWDEKAADRSLGVGLSADVPGIVGTDSGRLFVDDLTRRADPVPTGDWFDVVRVDDLPAVLTVATIDACPIENAPVGIALVCLDLHPVGVLVEIDNLLCLRCAGEEDQNGNCPHRRSIGGFTLVPPIFAPSSSNGFIVSIILPEVN